MRISIFAWSEPLCGLRGMWEFWGAVGRECQAQQPEWAAIHKHGLESSVASSPPSEITSFICDSPEIDGVPIPRSLVKGFPDAERQGCCPTMQPGLQNKAGWGGVGGRWGTPRNNSAQSGQKGISAPSKAQPQSVGPWPLATVKQGTWLWQGHTGHIMDCMLQLAPCFSLTKINLVLST